MKLKINDRVQMIENSWGSPITWTGTITNIRPDGSIVVKWDTGITEVVPADELTLMNLN